MQSCVQIKGHSSQFTHQAEDSWIRVSAYIFRPTAIGSKNSTRDPLDLDDRILEGKIANGRSIAPCMVRFSTKLHTFVVLACRS